MTEERPDWAFSALSPDVILDAMASLGWPGDGRLLALNSYENRVWQVGQEDGPPLIAKFYRPGRWSAAQIGEELAFVDELAAAEVPVVPALPAPRSGRTLNRVGPYWIAVSPRRGGRALEIDRAEQLHRIGCALGRLHNVGARQPFAHRPALGCEEFGHRAIEAVMASPLLPASLRANYHDIAHRVLAKVEAVNAAAASTPTLRLHGDCHVANIMVREEQLHLVDFDDARNGPAVQDLWLFLAGPAEDRRLALGELLDGYEQFRDFDRRELALIEPLRSLRLLHHAGWLARRWADPAFPAAFPWLGEPRFWEQNVQDLREQLAVLDEPVELLAWH